MEERKNTRGRESERWRRVHRTSGNDAFEWSVGGGGQTQRRLEGPQQPPTLHVKKETIQSGEKMKEKERERDG
jgi:hypothetical protein